MKFHEILTKNERDIRKNWNFAKKTQHFSMTEQQFEKCID